MPATMEIYQQFEALWHAGQDACLRLECHTGQVWLSFQVNLQQPPHQHQNSRTSKNSPSRQRRRERRKAARKAASDAVEASKVYHFVGDVAEKDAATPQAVHGDDAEQAGHHGLQAHEQKLTGQHDHDCTAAVKAAEYFPPPFKISQLDGLTGDVDDEPENVNIEADKLEKLSVMNVCSTDIPPDPYPCRFCLLVSELPNYPSPKPTDPVCTVCRRPIDDRFNPHSCCDLLMHENCWGQHRCIGWE